jgi:hypothetical protein
MLISGLAQLRASAVDAAKPKLAKTPDSGTFTWRCRSRFLTDRCRRFAGLRSRVSLFQRGHISQEECVKKSPTNLRGFLLLFKTRAGARGRERRTARRGVGAECVPRRALSAVRGGGGSPRCPGRCPVGCRAGRAARGGCSCGTAARSTAGRSAASLCKCEGARKGKSCSQCDCGELHSGFLGLMTKGKSP